MPIIYGAFISALISFNFFTGESLVDVHGFCLDGVPIHGYVLLPTVHYPCDQNGFHINNWLKMGRNNILYRHIWSYVGCLANSAFGLLYETDGSFMQFEMVCNGSVGFAFFYHVQNFHFLSDCQMFVFSFNIRNILKRGRTIRTHRW